MAIESRPEQASNEAFEKAPLKLGAGVILMEGVGGEAYSVYLAWKAAKEVNQATYSLVQGREHAFDASLAQVKKDATSAFVGGALLSPSFVILGLAILNKLTASSRRNS